jgi:HPt (histidine-containing phosphotransfer) domain-containing protein
MREMITLYLDQTPDLIRIMKQGLAEKDWESIHSAAHKMIPSFSIMGIPQEFENLAKMIQEYSGTTQHLDKLPELFLKLELVCSQACQELTEAYHKIKTPGHDK